jgi:hypothetical protein
MPGGAEPFNGRDSGRRVCFSVAMKSFALLLPLLLLSPAPRAAESDPKNSTYLDAKSAGADYAAQGEYNNNWGGAQVVALGADSFWMVTYRGGLPGDGWDKESKTIVEGRREGAKLVFTGENGYRAELANGKITINTANGGPYTMEKTERSSPTLGAKPPKGAVTLFDGSGVEQWEGGRLDGQGRGLLAAGTKSRQSFGSFTAHLEFLLPFKPLGRGQDRGNSGVYMQDRYEVQVLDSFGLNGENNECGGIYGVAKPAVNMCFPPLTWQTYDIDFTAAKYDASGMKTKNALLTVRHNGVLIHEKVEVPSATTASGRKEEPTPGPIQLQDHGNLVFYRNIWVLPK